MVNQTMSLSSPLPFHLQRGYDGEWLGGTFSKAVFVGNGLMAILAGLLAHRYASYDI